MIAVLMARPRSPGPSGITDAGTATLDVAPPVPCGAGFVVASALGGGSTVFASTGAVEAAGATPAPPAAGGAATATAATTTGAGWVVTLGDELVAERMPWAIGTWAWKPPGGGDDGPPCPVCCKGNPTVTIVRSASRSVGLKNP